MILKDFDLIHTTDQLFTMAKTGLYASLRFWKIHDDFFTYVHLLIPGYYIEKFLKLSRLVYYLFIDKIKLHQRILKNKKLKMNSYLMHCDKGMIDDYIPLKKYNFQSDVLDKITKLSLVVTRIFLKEKKIDKEFLFKKIINFWKNGYDGIETINVIFEQSSKGELKHKYRLVYFSWSKHSSHKNV